MSCGVMRIRASLSQAQRQVAQRRYKKAIEEINHEDHDHGREIESHRQRGQPAADRTQDRFRHAIQEAHDRVERIGAHPREDGARDDDPHVRDQYEVQNIGEVEEQIPGDEHYAGPRPSSRERWVARSTARMKVVRMPPSSSAAMPAMVVPPGLDTMSFSAPGCMPVSASRCAEPSTVWVASVMAVARSRPILTPPSASDSMTIAT